MLAEISSDVTKMYGGAMLKKMSILKDGKRAENLQMVPIKVERVLL